MFTLSWSGLCEKLINLKCTNQKHIPNTALIQELHIVTHNTFPRPKASLITLIIKLHTGGLLMIVSLSTMHS